MYIDLDYIDTVIRNYMPLPCDVDNNVFVEAWETGDGKLFNFIYKKILIDVEKEVYCIGWELVNAKEI